MPHSCGLSAVDTSPRLAPLIMLRSPLKLLLYRNRMKSVSVRLLQHIQQAIKNQVVLS